MMKKPLWVYVAVKDLSIWVLYFLLMKYNLTNETYTPSMQSNFPGAPRMGIFSMFVAAAFITWLPLIADGVVLSGVERMVKPDYAQRFRTVALGVVLHVPIVLFWLVYNASKGGGLNVAQQTGLLLSFLVAGGTMWALRGNFRGEAVKSKGTVQE